jgi:MSHA biogenesis protein MshP
MTLHTRSFLSRMRGFSLVTGIFLLVVLSALGAFMVVFTGLQQNTVQNDILGVRAYYAARAGINWAMYRALDPDNTIAPAPLPPWTPPLPFAACPAGTIAQGALGGSLALFAVTITCNQTDATEANRFIRIYEITATACNQASCVIAPAVPPTGYVERRVVVTVAKCKDPTAAAPRYECGS